MTQQHYDDFLRSKANFERPVGFDVSDPHPALKDFKQQYGLFVA